MDTCQNGEELYQARRVKFKNILIDDTSNDR